MGLVLFLGIWAGGCAGSIPEPPEPGTSASAEHEIHVQSGDLTRIINAAMRAMGALPEDSSPVPAPTAAKAIEALDHADVTYGLALSSAYFWGIPSLRSAPMLDSLGVDIGNERDRVRAENLYLAEQVARYPDRLVGACSVNPLASYALEELELCAADTRITAFSLHLAPAPVDFRDETHVARLRTFFEALARTDLPVIVHMRNRGEGYGAGDAGVFIREVLAAAPGVPVQIAHMAGWGPYDEATDSAMQAFVDAFEKGTLDRDRVTFGVGVLLDDPEELDDDTAAARRAAERNTRLAERMRQVGIERVVFSTDWPFFPPHGHARTRIARNRARLRNVLPLKPEELDRFFSNVGPVFRHLVESHSPAGSSLLTPATDTVRVARPTGEAATDRASILAALEALELGGTLLFAAGTYRIGGAFIRVPVPGVILQGHPDGTTLRGCEPADLVEHERMAECNGLELTGPRQTVRGFTFEQMGSALWVGCCLEPAAPDLEGGQPHVGGHLIEGNTFRGTWNGIRVIGDSPEAAVIRDNDFVNTWHAVTVNGRTAHILGNRVSVPDPEQVPVNGHAGIAIAVIAHDTMLERAFTCAGNVIAGNRIEGHPEAIGILAFQSGASCRENVIRDNTIAATRVRFSGPSWGVMGIREQADSTLAGVPIALADLSAQMAEFMGLPAGDHDEDLIHENRVEGNRVTGAEGLAIQLVGASRNRVVGNTIAGVRRREPFPGNTMIDDPEPWREANGSGIWVSPGSDGNVVAGNAFEGVAAYEVFIEGDGNRVELQSADDSVRDLGTGSRISGPSGSASADAPPIYESKSVEACGIRLQYMDFGGSGLPVIFVQDFHDYFSLEEQSQQAAWLSRFAEQASSKAPCARFRNLEWRRTCASQSVPFWCSP